jgi:hypothetical protein
VVQTPVNPLKDAIFLDGRSLSKKAPPKFYFALHKPKGLVSVHLLVLGPVLSSGVCEFCVLRLGFRTEIFTAGYDVRSYFEVVSHLMLWVRQVHMFECEGCSQASFVAPGGVLESLGEFPCFFSPSF